MGFYEQLSRYYDEVFPVSAGDMVFVNKALGGAGRVLDIGCGTGGKTALMAAKGRTVLGIDADPIVIARAVRDNSVPGATYETLDMRRLAERFTARAFDAAVCLGNTLVHLDGPEAVGGLLRAAVGLLCPEGALVLQILNYDRILDERVRTLPTLEGEHVVFERRYEWDGAMLRFPYPVTRQKSEEWFENAVPLYPLRRAELDAMLDAFEFRSVMWYGGFDSEPYDGTSLPALVTCRRG